MTGAEIAIGAMIAGGTMQALGQLQSGNAAKTAGDTNGAILDMNAKTERSLAAENARRQRRAGRKAGGTIRNNTFVTMDVLEDNLMEAELEAQSIEFMGETRAINFQNQAEMARFRGRQAKKASRLAAASTLLMSGAAAYGMAGNLGGSTVGSMSSRADPFLAAKTYGSTTNATMMTTGQAMPGFVY